LITDIAPPEFETRIEIVKTKARRDGVSIPDSVAHLIAEKFNSNVRELEGALNRIAAYAMIKSIPITLELTREVIKKISMDRVGRITHDLILKKLAEYFNLKVADLVSKRRHRAVSIPRHVAMYLIRKHTNHSLPEIGEFLGGRDHSTVITAINKITSLQKEDPLIERTLKDIERSLGV
jgi:chromosomal replication initiator protein